MSVIKITNENFEAEVMKDNKIVVLDFWAEWCGPCRMFSPVIDQLSEKNSDIKVGKVNVDEQSELAQKFGIVSIPTVIILKNGEIVSKSAGFKPLHELEALVESL